MSNQPPASPPISPSPSLSAPPPVKRGRKLGRFLLAAGILLFVIVVAVVLPLLTMDWSFLDKEIGAARAKAERQRSDWLRSPAAKAVFSLTGKSSFYSDPDAGISTMSYSSDDAGFLIELVPVAAGKFVRGSDRLGSVSYQNVVNGRVELNVVLESRPAREITLTRDFLIGRTEVTVGQFKLFVNATGYVTDAERQGKMEIWRCLRPAPVLSSLAALPPDDLPVLNVSWNDANAFLAWLNQADKKRPADWEYRLPTEAEWEYACRAGGTGDFAFGDELLPEQANFDFTGAHKNRVGADIPGYSFPLPGGSYPPNAWGVHDMHGNAAEWCLDWYDREFYADGPGADPANLAAGEYRVIRGGGWDDGAENCMSARRYCSRPDSSNSNTGFRLVLASKEKAPRTAQKGNWTLRNGKLVKTDIREAFGPAADFSGMTGEGGFGISDVLHQARIEVDESGAKAAAATAVVVTRSASKPKEFVLDSPFVFLVRHSPTGAVILLGRVDRPGIQGM